MMSQRKMVACCVAVAATVVFGEDIQLAKTFDDARTGLVVHYPEDWNLDNDSLVFSITSFSPKDRPPQILVPLNGAQIVVMRAPKGVSSVSDWLLKDRARPDRGYSVREMDLSTRHLGRIHSTVTHWEGRTVIPEGKSTDYYLPFEGGLCKASVLYRGQAKAEYFESVLRAIIEDLERRQ